MIKNNISEITRRDILDILFRGILEEPDITETLRPTKDFFDNGKNEIKINYHGRLDEIGFLKRLYKLNEIESYDNRYKDAEGDIFQHRVRNLDWPDDWLFTDERFGLYDNDEIFLNFISEVFHPVVREEAKPWKRIFVIVNDLLKQDGYELYEKTHISGRAVYGWKETNAVSLEIIGGKPSRNVSLKLIGEGSYAQVFKFHDDFYDTTFVLKRAKKNLTEKEIERFKREFDEMKKMKSPYIVSVYSYNGIDNEYIMEQMDKTLNKYIEEKNGTLTFFERKNLCIQFLKAFRYIHSKSLLHRDISHKNILVKIHDDGTNVVKVSDFGLVKIPDSDLTSVDTQYKGLFNDPLLRLTGFSTYNILHETYAITRLVFYTLTGRLNTDKIKGESLRVFVSKGLNPDLKKRYQDVDDLINGFQQIKNE